MINPTMADLKSGIQDLDKKKLTEISLRMARFGTQNKILLGFLLFGADDEQAYTREVMEEIERLYYSFPHHLTKATKTGLRKVLKTLKQYARFFSNKENEVVLIIHYLKLLRELRSPYCTYPSFESMVKSLKKRAVTLIDKLHEDLQYDFQVELDALEDFTK